MATDQALQSLETRIKAHEARVIAHIVNSREILRKSAELMKMKGVDKMTRDSADILRGRGGPVLESLRRDIFKLRDQGRLLKKAHDASKRQLRRLAARVFDIDSNLNDLGVELTRFGTTLKQMTSNQRKFSASFDAYAARLDGLKKSFDKAKPRQ